MNSQLLDKKCLGGFTECEGKIVDWTLFSIILVGDIAQLPPVLDRPLYCSVSEDPMAMMKFLLSEKLIIL